MNKLFSNSLISKSIKSITNKDKYRFRQLQVSAKRENSLIFGGLAVATAAIGLQYALKALKNIPLENSAENKTGDEKTTRDSSSSSASSSSSSSSSSIFGDTSTWFAKNFYDGGFEDKMTKREAALILGIRESATVERIKDAHRRILLLNHPDRGGSAYMAAKINEAKDHLIKGKQ